ncbi:CinA family protein [Aestuariibacter salexigens]|uniref:CinA family protein n=1 Tax=Aestuariibacter salexigens TaxID=226010 RepID=UPI000478D46D|nr:CinA family protein [Aestuariibacter salexigens]
MLSNDIIELASLLGDKLCAKGWTVTTAESCTGGGIAYAITSRSGSSQWFRQAFVTYSNDAKQNLLSVSPHILQTHGAVSKHTVEKMVSGVCQAANAEVGVAVSGVAGPDGGSDDKPVGTVWFGFQVDGTLTTLKQHFDGDRHLVREQTIRFALQHLLSVIPS